MPKLTLKKSGRVLILKKTPKKQMKIKKAPSTSNPRYTA